MNQAVTADYTVTSDATGTPEQGCKTHMNRLIGLVE
jgi:hypothetical protein